MPIHTREIVALGGISVEWGSAIDHYLSTLAAGARAPGTVRLHRHYLRMFARIAGPVSDVREGDILEWLSTPGWAPETRKSARCVIVAFYRWAARTGQCGANPAANLPSIRIPAAEARPAPQAVFDYAIANATDDQRTMLRLARYAALRCCEIAAIHRDDLDGDLLYVTGKGGKRRIVPILDTHLIDAITAADGYLFPGQINGHVSAAWVSRQLGRLLEGDWTAHKLRHAFASAAYAHNPDIYALAKFMGHARVETTQRYTQMRTENLRRVAEAAA